MSTGETVVIGVGNALRGDDGIGPAVAAALARQDLPGVRIVDSPADPADLLDLWAGAALAIVVDAVRGDPGAAGEILLLGDGGGWFSGAPGSSHALGVADAVRLGAELDLLPDRLIMIGVVAAGFELGTALSEPVAGALPYAVCTVLAALGCTG